MSKIYKYFSHNVFELVFQRAGFCGIKCSFPKDYNDPYELFLGMDLTVPVDLLATYNDIINEIPQYPTTCFSRSPIVSPMWAHYAKEHTGFVLEFDKEELNNNFQGCQINDVTYRDKPDEGLKDLLAKASIICKPRYAVWLLNSTFMEAYFSKYTEWSYEQESRFVDLGDFTENIDRQEILFVPSSCVTSIIIGSKFPTEKIGLSIEKATEYNMAWYKLKIGKSFPVPYMSDASHKQFIFKGSSIIQSEHICTSCSEPLFEEADLCPWCAITEAHRLDAARKNPLRILDHSGQLEGYLEGVSKIGK